MTLSETNAILAAAGYEPLCENSSTYSKVDGDFIVYIEDRTGLVCPWAVSIWDNVTSDELEAEFFDALDETIAFARKYVERVSEASFEAQTNANAGEG